MDTLALAFMMVAGITSPTIERDLLDLDHNSFYARQNATARLLADGQPYFLRLAVAVSSRNSRETQHRLGHVWVDVSHKVTYQTAWYYADRNNHRLRIVDLYFPPHTLPYLDMMIWNVERKSFMSSTRGPHDTRFFADYWQRITSEDAALFPMSHHPRYCAATRPWLADEMAKGTPTWLLLAVLTELHRRQAIYLPSCGYSTPLRSYPYTRQDFGLEPHKLPR